MTLDSHYLQVSSWLQVSSCLSHIKKLLQNILAKVDSSKFLDKQPRMNAEPTKLRVVWYSTMTIGKRAPSLGHEAKPKMKAKIGLYLRRGKSMKQ